MRAGSFCKSTAAGAISRTCSFGAVSSAFRISIAPVSISVAVLAGAMASALSSLVVVGATGCLSGAAMSCAANNSLSNPAASPSSAPTSPGIMVLSAISADGASPAMSMAAAGSGDLSLSDPACMCRAWLSTEVSALSTLLGCGVCIIANRLANNARVSASAPRFNPGASPFGGRVWPTPNASIVFMSMPRSLPATGQNLCAQRENPAGTLQKGCQSHPQFRDQPRRRGGIEASNRASRSS